MPVAVLSQANVDTSNKFMIGITIGGIISNQMTSSNKDLSSVLRASKYNGEFTINSYYFLTKNHGILFNLGFCGGPSHLLPGWIKDNHPTKVVVETMYNTLNTTSSTQILVGYVYKYPISKRIDLMGSISAGLLNSGFMKEYSFNIIDLNTTQEEFHGFTHLNDSKMNFSSQAQASINVYVSKYIALQANLGLMNWSRAVTYKHRHQIKGSDIKEEIFEFSETQFVPKVSFGVYLNIANYLNF